MKTTLSLVFCSALLTVPMWSADVPYFEGFDGYASGDTAVTNFTELGSAVWTINSPSYSGKAYQNSMTVFSSGVGVASGQLGVSTIEFPSLAASSFVISTTFRIDTFTLTGSDPANTAYIGLRACSPTVDSTADRYEVFYILDTNANATTGHLYLNETNLFNGRSVFISSGGDLPVTVGEIYTFTFSGTRSGGSLALSATLSNSLGSVSVAQTDSLNVLSGSFFGYDNFAYTEDGGMTVLDADFDHFSASVPEPGGLLLTAFGGGALLARRRARKL